MDQQQKPHKVAEWDFAPSGEMERFTMSFTPHPPPTGGPVRPHRFALTHDQALFLAMRMVNRLRG